MALLFLVLLLALRGSLFHAPLAGNFYAIFPHALMIVITAMLLADRRLFEALRNADPARGAKSVGNMLSQRRAPLTSRPSPGPPWPCASAALRLAVAPTHAYYFATPKISRLD